MRRSFGLALPMLLLATFAASADEGPSRSAVADAIASGSAYLSKQYEEAGFEGRSWHDPLELVMLTFSHAGVSGRNPAFRKGLEVLTTCKLQYTYRVGTLAMALERINARMYRGRLAHCAQWLVDTQLPGGEWGYPGSLGGSGGRPDAIEVEPPVPSADEAKTTGNRTLRIKRGPTKPSGKGDFSNTQFAILGLRACKAAGIEIPKATWKAALAYILKYQRRDGGWGYVYAGEQDGASYASLTCAGVCSIAICLDALGKKKIPEHPAIRKGLAWLAQDFRADHNTGVENSTIIGPGSWQYYYLYSVERVGRIVGVDAIGETAWYPAGASYLVAKQRADGSWSNVAGSNIERRPQYMVTADTCFALLFLTRATPPLTGE